MYPSADETTELVTNEVNWDAGISHAARYGFVEDRPSDEDKVLREFEHVAPLNKHGAQGLNEGHVYEYFYSAEERFNDVEELVTGGPGSEIEECHADLCRKERHSMLMMLRWLSAEGPCMDVEMPDSRQSTSRYESHVMVSRSPMLAI